MPARIQRRRTPGWRAPLDHLGRPPVYVGRPSRWAPPFRVVGGTVYGPPPGDTGDLIAYSSHAPAADAVPAAVEAYRRWLTTHPGLAAAARRDLAGRDLMCWCPTPAPGQPDHCHAAVLLTLANPTSRTRR